MKEAKDKLRIDKYLWAIRIFKTRSQASEACDKGRVKLNDAAVKASKNVIVGDVYAIKAEERKWVIQVNALLDYRVQYAEAIKYYIDRTPEEENEKPNIQPASFYTGKRQSKTGKPTKKQRRDFNDFTSEF